MKKESSIHNPANFLQGNVLWDNYVDDYNNIIAAQHEPPGTPNRLDVFPADDFIFTENTDVYRVYWGGGYFQCNYAEGPKDYHFDWNITFFEDDGSGNNPGSIFAGPFTILDEDLSKSHAVINDSTVSNGAWGCGYFATLPNAVTFNANTKYWVTIYGLDETFPQSAVARHNESIVGVLLHQAKLKSDYFGYPNWTNISDALGEDSESDLLFALLGPEPDFEVTISKGLGVTAEIKHNIGLFDPTNVTATITVTGGLVIYGATQTISLGDITPGSTATAKVFILGLGNIDIEVVVSCERGLSGYGKESGLLLLFFIL
jgi:hypothetical protein